MNADTPLKPDCRVKLAATPGVESLHPVATMPDVMSRRGKRSPLSRSKLTADKLHLLSTACAKSGTANAAE
jgi:hypothetical protein